MQDINVQAVASGLHRSAFGLLSTAVDLVVQDSPSAADFWASIAPRRSDRNPAELRFELFWRAIGRRIRGADTLMEDANLYLSRFENNQIDIFNLMATKMPLVNLAGRISNGMLTAAIQSGASYTLIDVGIGTGQQEVALLHALHAQQIAPACLNVVGIEPAEESIVRARENILSAAQKLRINVTFNALISRAEDLTQSQWDDLRRYEGSLLINGAFALHHAAYSDRIASDARLTADAKQDVLDHLHNLRPTLLVLTEPDSDHEDSRLRSRFVHAWNHFGLVFDVIDKSEISTEAGALIKAFFFGREIEDIISGGQQSRCERHETAAMWIQRLHTTGFRPAAPIVEDVSSTPIVQIRRHGISHYTLDHAGSPVVAIIGAGT